MADRDDHVARGSDESLAETASADLDQESDLGGGLGEIIGGTAGSASDDDAGRDVPRDPGAGSIDEARIAERGAGDESPFDASEAYSGQDEDEALANRQQP